MVGVALMLGESCDLYFIYPIVNPAWHFDCILIGKIVTEAIRKIGPKRLG